MFILNQPCKAPTQSHRSLQDTYTPPPPHSLRPPFPCGDREEGQQGPDDVVVVEFMTLPFPALYLHLIFLVIYIVASESRIEMKQGFLSIVCGTVKHFLQTLRMLG